MSMDDRSRNRGWRSGEGRTDPPGMENRLRENRNRGIKYMIGIPAAVVLVVLASALIGGGSGGSSPVARDLEQFRLRMTQYTRSQDMALLIAKALVLFVSFPVHECAHAWMADKLGDPTGRRMGRITLNPFKHLELWGTVSILLFGVGYAKPVPVQISNFKNRKRDFALTALAGPVSNLLMAAALLLLLRFLPGLMGGSAAYETVARVVTYTAYINVSLAVFNLIPIPPLDGSRVLTALLPDGAYDKMLSLERYTMIILFIVLIVLGRTGYSPIGIWSGRVFQFMYRIFIGA